MVRMDHGLLIHLPVDGQFGGFQFGAALDLQVHVFVWMCDLFFLSRSLRVELLGHIVGVRFTF